jgi:PAS domain S-box-containing protein
MDLEVEGPGARSPDIEPGMNIISADFDLIMVNRPNERLYGKPMVELLGKKCYREFEKRDEPCSHCPGRLSLVTGGTHEAETEGLRDDGTWFSARVRTHPLQGLGDVPTGFIEVVEDITEEKRAEKLGRIEADLRKCLAPVQNVRKALTLAFEAALRVESIDAGCVVLLAGEKGQPDLVAGRGLREETLQILTRRAADPECADLLEGVADAPRSVAAIPILHRSEAVAIMIAASSTYQVIPPTLLAGLHSLGATVAGAIGRIWAEQSRGDAVADLEAIITHAPMAAFILDPTGRVTMWNRTAERLFGWRASEVLKHPCPFSQLRMEDCRPATDLVVEEIVLESKDGRGIDVRLTMTPFRDVLGVASTLIVMVEDLTATRRLAEMEARLQEMEGGLAAGEERSPAARRSNGSVAVAADQAASARGEPILLIGDQAGHSRTLARVLEQLGYEPVVFASLPEAVAGVATGPEDGRPFAAAVVEMISGGGSNGLADKAALREAGLDVPVIMSSDVDVKGYVEHGFAGVIRRPYLAGEVRETVEEALRVSA